MTLVCVNLAFYWFLVFTGPAPIVVGDQRGYRSEEDCQIARIVLSRQFSVDPFLNRFKGH